jgi:hypothetical protein
VIDSIRRDVANADEISEDARWRRWKMKGRDDDARFQRRLKAVIINVAAVVAIGGALWFAIPI